MCYIFLNSTDDGAGMNVEMLVLSSWWCTSVFCQSFKDC